MKTMDIQEKIKSKNFNKKQINFINRLFKGKGKYTNKDLAKIWGAKTFPSGFKSKLLQKPPLLKLINQRPQMYEVIAEDLEEDLIEPDFKNYFNNKLEQFEKLIIKERIYQMIPQGSRENTISSIISHFHKFFNKDTIDFVLLELYFENLIDFSPKVSADAEKVMKLVYKKNKSNFPISIRKDDLQIVIKENYLILEKVLGILKKNPDYIQFSPISIGGEKELIIIKQFWKSNSIVWRTGN